MKWTEICDTVGSVIYAIGSFDFVMFRVILWPFGALLSKLPETRKWLVMPRNGLNFGDKEQITHILDTFDLIVLVLFRVILGVRALFFKAVLQLVNG